MQFPHSRSIGIRLTAALSGALVLMAAAGPASAQMTSSYTDVPAGAYYEGAAEALLELGALDAGESRLRPGDYATRAEMAKLMVNLSGKAMLTPAAGSFSDVPRGTWYYPYIETAARAGWIHGDDNCYTEGTRPCTARPGDRINRAEAAALLNRIFSLTSTDRAPAFMDNPAYEWYYDDVQTAADHCVLQGDADTGLVRPASSMNRAEMIVMFHRAYLNQTYGTDCGQSAAEITSVTALSANKIRVTFSDAMDETRAETESAYNVARASDRSVILVDGAAMVNTRTVDLTLRAGLSVNVPYVLTVRNLKTRDGATFNDTADVLFTGNAGHINGVSATTAGKIRLTFDTDIDTTRADDAWRYAVTRITGGSGSLTVATASVIDARTVELGLAGSLLTGTQYRVEARDMATSGGVLFTDAGTVLFTAPVGALQGVTVLSTTRLRATFSEPLDRSRAEEVSHYTLSDGTRIIGVQAAYLTNDNRSVELVLDEGLKPQRMYTLSVTGLMTMQGITFNGTGSTVFAGGTGTGGSVSFSASLSGTQETPAVSTAMTGTGTFRLAADGLHYDITVSHLSGSVTAAHFHQGAAGIAGPVIQPITFTGNRAMGVWTNLTAQQRNWILDGSVYVNVHTAAYPNGEIRGQLNP